ncbi:hypothetical protein K1719_022969 [Acacia pycnantha]|nr:hypothetical protein K1719_022969 [Acacia pycnantha]
MSCLLPQFKCQPDTFSIHFRAHPHVTLPSSHSHSHSHLVVCIAFVVDIFCIKFIQKNSAHCLLSATSPSTSSSNGSTAVLSLEKLALTTLDGNSDSVATNRPWTYIGTTGPPTEASFKATLATESLITSEEAVIAAAASEAVALAKAAVKVAKDAAMLAKNKSPIESEYKPSVSSKPDNLLLKWVRHMEAEDGLVGGSLGTEAETMRDCSINNNEEESEDVEPTNEELESLEEQLFGNIAVRSKRQTERKARRARAAERASTNSLSFKATTSTSKLLSPTEELELSEGIQDLLKLEKLQNDLAERCGCPPTFAQWAAAARVDGTFCKDKMIKSNIWLVISIATNYQGAGMNLQDLVQVLVSPVYSYDK